MKDEIKEILNNDNIHIIECDKNWCNAYGYEKSQMKSDVIKYITILEKEIERLNNIINELEKYLKEIMESYGYENDITDRIEKIVVKNILNKLKKIERR